MEKLWRFNDPKKETRRIKKHIFSIKIKMGKKLKEQHK
jgi:hypothetical protein